MGCCTLARATDRGWRTAERENKPLLLFFTAQWCHYCHQMAGEAFTNPQVVSLSEKFVCVLVDADSCARGLPAFSRFGIPHGPICFAAGAGAEPDRRQASGPSSDDGHATALQTAALRSQPNAPCAAVTDHLPSSEVDSQARLGVAFAPSGRLAGSR